MSSKEEIEIDHTKDSFCVRIPLITEQELKRIDGSLDSVTDEITKQVIKDKDLAIAQHIIQKQKDKIDQLEQENEALKKGQASLMASRKKWKDRYYKLSSKSKSLEADNYELNNRLNEYIEDNKKQNKMIDEMAKQLAGLGIWNDEKDEPLILGDKEEVKQYFEKKVEEK